MDPPNFFTRAAAVILGNRGRLLLEPWSLVLGDPHCVRRPQCCTHVHSTLAGGEARQNLSTQRSTPRSPFLCLEVFPTRRKGGLDPERAICTRYKPRPSIGPFTSPIFTRSIGHPHVHAHTVSSPTALCARCITRAASLLSGRTPLSFRIIARFFVAKARFLR